MARLKLYMLIRAFMFLIVLCFQSVRSRRCNSWDECSQMCTTSNACTCVTGFTLGPNKYSCDPANPNWKFLLATTDKLYFVSKDGRPPEEIDLSFDIQTIFSVAFNARSDTIYSVVSFKQPGDFDPRRPLNVGVLITKITPDGSETSHLTQRGLVAPRSVEFDWITGNLYYIEPSLNRITVCNSNSGNCAELINRRELATAHSITLIPDLDRDFLFWVEVNNNQSVIFRADLDGLNIVNITPSISPLVNSLTVDIPHRRLYWSGVGGDVITSKLFGQSKRDVPIQTIDTQVVHSACIFGDNLFLMRGNQAAYTIQSVDKMTGENVKNLSGIHAGAGNFLAVYNPASQPILGANPCKDNTECSHMCVLSRTPSRGTYRCLSPICEQNPVRTGVTSCHSTNHCKLEESLKLGIVAKSDYLVVAYDNILAFTLAANLKNIQAPFRFERFQISEIKSITTLVYNPFGGTVILSDSEQIYEYDLASRTLRGFVDASMLKGSKVLSLAFDELGENIYWITDAGSVSIASIRTKQTLELIRGLGNVCEILIIPDQRSFLLAIQHRTQEVLIKTYHLDGSLKNPEYIVPSSTCITWAYDKPSGYILWSEPGHSHSIEVIHLQQGGILHNYGVPLVSNSRTHVHYPSSIAKLAESSFWVDSDKLNLNQIQRIGDNFHSRRFLTECEFRQEKQKPTLFKSKLIATTQPKSNARQCIALECSHLCLVSSVPNTFYRNEPRLKCACSAGFELNLDDKTCRNPNAQPTTPSATGLGCEDDIVFSKNVSRNVTKSEGNVTSFTRTIFLLTQPSYETSSLSAIPTISFVFLLIFIISISAVLLVHFLREGNNRRSLTPEEIHEFYEGKVDAVMNYEKAAYHKETWEISKDSFEIDYEKSFSFEEFRGMFMGSVKRNVFLNYTASEDQSDMQSKEIKMGVMVKSSQPGSLRAIQGFLSEVKLMTYLGQHENIVSLIGAYTQEVDKGLVYAFMEVCEIGSLLRHLRCSEVDDGSFLEKWSLEVIRGMEFLSEKNIVHGRLCAENIWLTSSKTAKITGFGRRNLKNYNPSLWRWMAPEILQKSEFTEKSDVWACGVTLWEVHSFGKTPYADLARQNWNFVRLLKSEMVHLEKSEACDSEIYLMMQKCWNMDPSSRPTFTQLKEELIDMFNSFV